MLGTMNRSLEVLHSRPIPDFELSIDVEASFSESRMVVQ